MITQQHIDKSISFEEYYQFCEKLVKEGKTSGIDQKQSLIDYTKLNLARMKRVLKTFVPSPAITDTVECFNEKLTWLVLSESWCGDAAQNLPVLAKISEINTNISISVLLRDENPQLMDQYLTNGARSIPKLICLDENLNTLGCWGPRPKILQDQIKAEKANPTIGMDELKKQFQLWYAKDKGLSLQKEMVLLMQHWLNKECFELED